MNTSAPYYEKLKTLFESGNALSFAWEDKALNLFKIMETVLGRDIHSYNHVFDLNEINTVCPSLKNTLDLVLNRNSLSPLFGPTRTRTIEVVWRHCASPTLPLTINKRNEIYIDGITQVHNINKDENVAILCCNIYELQLEEKIGEETQGLEQKELVIDRALDQAFEAQNQEIDLTLLENNYPGFTRRALTALALNLSPHAVADYACSTTTELVAELRVGSIALPSLE